MRFEANRHKHFHRMSTWWLCTSDGLAWREKGYIYTCINNYYRYCEGTITSTVRVQAIARIAELLRARNAHVRTRVIIWFVRAIPRVRACWNWLRWCPRAHARVCTRYAWLKDAYARSQLKCNTRTMRRCIACAHSLLSARVQGLSECTINERH